MQKRFYPFLLLLFFTLSFSPQAFSQKKSAAFEKKIKKANELFNLTRYDEALPLYLELNTSDPGEAGVNYAIGVCYMESNEANLQIKATPYLEFAVKNITPEIPAKVYYHLGINYHKTYQFDQAIKSFEDFKKADRNWQSYPVAKMIEYCKNARELHSSPLEVFVQNMGSTINTQYTEYSPLTNAEEDLLIYTALAPKNTDKSSSRSTEVETIYASNKKNGEWSTPKSLEINSNFNVGSAALSPDGQKMLIFMGGVDNTGDIFHCELNGDKWSAPSSLGNTINSRYLENSASMTPDEQVIYFASNKPGGYGGMDIYKSEKDKNGKWGNAVNLGPEVNSTADEEAPFIHPDQKTLYFHSSGHNSMGGNDIFKSSFANGKWQKAENMGYPVNTPFNDNYFVLSPDGSKGYFSSDRDGGQGKQDIYFLGVPQEQNMIALTMIKGRILAGDLMKPVPTKIRVIDKEANSLVQGVYNPNSKTGNYLIILPPGKSYDMVIEAQGYLPHLVKINVPSQMHFYELYQMIHLKPVKQFDEVVGQEVIVKNAFYDNKQSDKVKVDPRKANEALLVRDSLDVYDLMDKIIAASDSVAFEYLLDLMYTTNPIENIDFTESSETEALSVTYFTEDYPSGKLQEVKVGDETIYTLPEVDMSQAKKGPSRTDGKEPFSKDMMQKVSKIYFDSNKSDLKNDFIAELNKVLAELQKNPDLGIEIAGYADAVGNKEYNLNLSNKRASTVLQFFNSRGIARRRIIAKGFGQSSDEGSYKNDTDKQKDRKVEIRIIEFRN
jgi:outer membrane protein OmpA-like peptidoglycan-associated protein